MQLWQRNIQVWRLMRRGRILDQQQQRWVMGNYGPYMKTFFFMLWPWKSRNSSKFCRNYCLHLLTNSFKAIISGNTNLSGFKNSRLKSLPDNPVLQFPATTPSGLSIGTTFHTTLLRKYSAAGVGPHRNSRNPCIMNEPLDSPGWARPEMTTHFVGTEGYGGYCYCYCWCYWWDQRVCCEEVFQRKDQCMWTDLLCQMGLFKGWWMVRRGTQRAPSELQSLLIFRQLLDLEERVQIHFIRVVYSYGTQQANCTQSSAQSKVYSKLSRQNFCLYKTQILLTIEYSFIPQSLILIPQILPGLLPPPTLFLRPHKRFHPPRIQTLRLLKVTDIKLPLCRLLGIRDLKIIPLQMSSCVSVNQQKQVVLVMGYLYRTVEITRLEQRVEAEIVTEIRVVTEEGPIGESQSVWGADVGIWEAVWAGVVKEVAVLETGAEVGELVRCLGLGFEELSHQYVNSVILIEQWYRIGKQYPRHPSRCDIWVQRIRFILDLWCRRHNIPHLLLIIRIRLKSRPPVHKHLFLPHLIVTREAIEHGVLLQLHWLFYYIQMSKVLKVILVGDMNTGKSSLLYRVLKQRQLDEHFPTVGVQVGTKSFFHRNTNLHLQFWDTAGQQRFRSVCHQHYRGAHAAILLFDLTDRRTFDSLPNWLIDIREQSRSPDMLICLFANKVDAVNRAVSRQEATTFASINGIPVYEEISAQTGENLEKAFGCVLDHFVERQGEEEEERVRLTSRKVGGGNKKCCS